MSRHTRLILRWLAVLLVCSSGWAVGAAKAQTSGAIGPRPTQRPLGHNTREFGYYAPRWRRWPGDEARVRPPVQKAAPTPAGPDDSLPPPMPPADEAPFEELPDEPAADETPLPDEPTPAEPPAELPAEPTEATPPVDSMPADELPSEADPLADPADEALPGDEPLPPADSPEADPALPPGVDDSGQNRLPMPAMRTAWASRQRGPAVYRPVGPKPREAAPGPILADPAVEPITAPAMEPQTRNTRGKAPKRQIARATTKPRTAPRRFQPVGTSRSVEAPEVSTGGSRAVRRAAGPGEAEESASSSQHLRWVRPAEGATQADYVAAAETTSDEEAAGGDVRRTSTARRAVPPAASEVPATEGTLPPVDRTWSRNPLRGTAASRALQSAASDSEPAAEDNAANPLR